MKHKTAELTGNLLDAAVAMAQGMPPLLRNDSSRRTVGGAPFPFYPSIDWACGGPIIERERMYAAHTGERWEVGAACEYGHEGPECKFYGHGPTLLVAAMRAFVASKLGDEVDLPE